MNDFLRYQRAIEPGIEESLSRIAALIEPNSLVLDVGCSSGMLGRFLVRDKACVIDGVDIDEDAVAICTPLYRKVAVKNLEHERLTDTFSEMRYDYIVVADVVEHLVDPTLLLDQLKLLVKPGGSIYFSIPNITHIAAGLQLLSGKFSYAPSGLLDSTHLRFFTRESFIFRLERQGIYCWSTCGVVRGIQDTEFGDDIGLTLPQPWLDQLIEDRQDALTYQWIFEARIQPPPVDRDPSPDGDMPRAIPLLNASLYWDCGQGFSEERKTLGSARILPSECRLLEFALDSIAADAPCQRLRIDPFCSPQWMKLKAAQLADASGVVQWRWQAGANDGHVVNAALIKGTIEDERILVGDHADPHWIPAIPAARMAGLVKGWKFSMEVEPHPQMKHAELALRLTELQRREDAFEELSQEKAVLAKLLEAKEKELASHVTWLREANTQLTVIISSRSWRMTAPLRWLTKKAHALLQHTRRLVGRASRIPGMLWRNGIVHSVHRFAIKRRAISYAEWIVKYEANRGLPAEHADNVAYQPLISIIMPTYNTPPAMLEEAILSVRRQLYRNWELCIADDASTSPEVRDIIRRHANGDKRLRPIFREQNGHISVASNSALEAARGEYVAFLDHDDRLAPHALARLALEINAHPAVDILYSDEDKISEDGRRSGPFFKPDWSPHLAVSQAYLGHLVCYRTDLVRQVGGLRAGFEGAQDYDLWLRAANRAREIRHVPQVLYHWRMHPASTAANGDAKPYAHEAGRKAVDDYLKNRYPDCGVEAADGEHLFTYRAKFALPTDLTISIIIPTRDKAQMLEACVRSILGKSRWQHYEILIVDNNSQEPETLAFFDSIQKEDARIRISTMPMPFNWSRINNLAARDARGEVLVFLNNDTAVINEDWLENLAGYARLPDVGTVGALLQFEDGTIQHSGVVVGMQGWAEHVFRAMPPIHAGSPFVSPVLTRNVLAVTGACVAITREKFKKLGGFDEEFIICGSDVELGLRAHRCGLYNVLCADARLYHYESKTRSPYVPDSDFVQSEKKYAPYRRNLTDPYFNPNLSLDSTTPSLRQ